MAGPWRKILVPHDFSSMANQAAALARDEAKLRDARLVLLHVVDLGPYDGDMLVIPPNEAPISMREYAIRSAEKHLHDLAARLEADGVPVNMAVRCGYASEEINQFVAENGIDLIVMGSHSRTGVARLMTGGVTERVFRTASVPVLAIR
jgi:nucleotide-binding universal stress UspA family protein